MGVAYVALRISLPRKGVDMVIFLRRFPIVNPSSIRGGRGYPVVAILARPSWTMGTRRGRST